MQYLYIHECRPIHLFPDRLSLWVLSLFSPPIWSVQHILLTTNFPGRIPFLIALSWYTPYVTFQPYFSQFILSIYSWSLLFSHKQLYGYTNWYLFTCIWHRKELPAAVVRPHAHTQMKSTSISDNMERKIFIYYRTLQRKEVCFL